MKRKILLPLIVFCVVTLTLSAVSVAAETYGNLTYSVSKNGEITITGCTGSPTAIKIPSTIDGFPVTGIDVYAFNGCSRLTSITIPDSVTSIGDDAFRSCTSLTSITIPDSVTNIGGGAFSYCTRLISISIPDSVTSIGASAFYNTAYYKDDSNWENDVLYIGNHLIEAKRSLSGTYTIRDNTKTIASSAFYKCADLTSITIPNSVTSIGGYTFDGCSRLTSITIPESVTNIGGGAFSYCTGLTSISIPDSVTSIGDYAFQGCSSLTSISIPDSVTSIGDYAFQGCSSLTSITIPESVTNIGGGAFEGCSSLTSITIPDSVTSIRDYAFNGCSRLTSITMPESVTSIGDDAFYNTAYYKDDSNWENDVLYIGNHLIEAKRSLSGTYTIRDNTKTIGDYAFYNCTGLTNINIPDSVTSIGYSAFSDCTGLTSVTMGNGVTSIGDYAFYNCTGLTSITIPESVRSIGDSVFRDCTGLTSVTIGNGVTNIGYSAFNYCKNLTGVTIPNSISTIDGYAFYECNSLSNVFYNGDEQQWNKIYIESENDCLKNAKREYFWYVGIMDENGTEISKKKYEPGSLIDISDIEEKSGHTIRLYTDKECQTEFDLATPVTENLTLYIKYVSNKFNAKFLDEDGKVLKEGLNDYGEVITPPENPTKENTQQYTYTFAGWDGFYEGITQTNSEMVFTAKYTETVNQYTYKFLDEDGTVLKEATEDYGTVINAPEHSDKTEYYIFDSWKNYSDNMVLTDNIEFTAVYKYKDYSVTAIGLDNPIVVTYNSDYRIEPQAKDGCKFAGYYTEPDGKGTKVTGENGESLKAYDFVVDITVYPYFYNLYTNKIEIQGFTSAMPGDEIKQKVVFATDKEVKYFVATVKYPKYLNLKSISAVDFAEVSKDSEKEEDGFKYTDITCMYDPNENMPVNENLIPFEIVFEAEKDAPLGNAEITVQNVSLIGDDGEYQITDIKGNNVTILGKLAEKIEIIGENSINKATKFSAVVSPEYTANKNVTWSVDNEAVASVSENGTLTPHKNGSIILTATTQDGSHKVAVKSIDVTAYATLSSLKYGDTDIELEPYKYNYTIYVEKDLPSISITPTFQEGALKFNGTGIWISGKTKEFDLIDDETVITLNRNSVPDMTDSEYKITVLKHEFTQTTVSEDKKEFTVKPINFEKKCIVILALYNGNRFVGMQTALFDGEDLHFTTDIEYTTAKVMAWDNFSAMIPLSKAELIK